MPKQTVLRSLVVLALGWLVGACGSSKTLPAIPSLSRLQMPAFAPDSSALAFVSYGAALSPAAPSGLLVTRTADGVRMLVSPAGRSPAWSPDAKTIAYSNPGLTLTAVETGSTTELTAFEVYGPDWSPNGEQIAFAAYFQDPRGSNAIWLIRPDGTQLTDISVHGTGEWITPAWDPDGTALVHARYGPGMSVSQIYVMKSDGSGGRRLSYSNELDYYPRWSPDSSTVAFVRQRPGRETIWLMDPDGSNPRFLTDGTHPAWLPSGAGIIYTPPFEVRPPVFWIINKDGTGRRAFGP